MSLAFCHTPSFEKFYEYPFSPCFTETLFVGLLFTPSLFFFLHYLIKRQIEQNKSFSLPPTSALPNSGASFALPPFIALSGRYRSHAKLISLFNAVAFFLQFCLIIIPTLDLILSGILHVTGTAKTPTFHYLFLAVLIVVYSSYEYFLFKIKDSRDYEASKSVQKFLAYSYAMNVIGFLILGAVIWVTQHAGVLDPDYRYFDTWTLIILTSIFSIFVALVALRIGLFCCLKYHSDSVDLEEQVLMEESETEDETEVEDDLFRKSSSSKNNFDPSSNRSPLPFPSKYKKKMTWTTKLKQVLPYLWPSKDRFSQFMVIISLVCLSLARAVNILVPLQYKHVIDVLSKISNGEQVDTSAFSAISLFVFLRFLQGSVGLVASVQGFCWIKVGQYTTRNISVTVFDHLHKLSLRFHLNKKTGEVLRILDRGTSSIVALLNSIIFNIVPTFVDIGIACVFFIVSFDIWFGYVVFLTMVYFIAITVLITRWRTKYRRAMNELENKATAKAVDSLLNFETVKYFGAESYEVAQYDSAFLSYQWADWLVQSSLYFLNTFQNIVITLGLLVGSSLCVRRVLDGYLTVGDFVLYLAYITQLYVPLNWLGTYYRTIQQNFIDMEKMLELLQEDITVQDSPLATNLKVTSGEIVFDDVSFSYGDSDKKLALRGISFAIPAGQTVALVGPSGGGKSTILRLLFRFYDVKGGSIRIDGQDIRSIKLNSLREALGVVPQDTVLFHESILYNIRYGNLSASDEDVIRAAKAAQIHDTILGFPDGYSTKVGERGLRLSGGEKQRVAIARTILKNPKMIVLDEATSALDTNTERIIQEALREITANRTTLIVAHRLSTIIHADKILVLKDGSILEQGSHMELLARRGLYHELWTKQQDTAK